MLTGSPSALGPILMTSLAALILWLLMSDIMFNRRPDLRPLRRLPFVIGVGLVLIASAGSSYNATARDAVILALASLPVAIHEEFFFRGILQNTLVKHFGAVGGILATVFLFASYHVGVTPLTYINVSEIIVGGLILCLIYLRTGSMMSVIIVHTLDDAAFSIPPIFGWFSATWVSVLELLAAGLVLSWACRQATVKDRDAAACEPSTS